MVPPDGDEAERAGPVFLLEVVMSDHKPLWDGWGPNWPHLESLARCDLPDGECLWDGEDHAWATWLVAERDRRDKRIAELERRQPTECSILIRAAAIVDASAAVNSAPVADFLRALAEEADDA